MKKYVSLMIILLICLLSFSGCSCKHTWIEATCVSAKTCSICNVAEGEPLGHTPGQWQETADPVAATVSRVQHCTVCNDVTAAETVPLNAMIQDELFIFTPNEFMERLAALANQYVDGFSYEFITNNGLMAYVYSNEKQSILQFFRHDATLLSSGDKDVAEVWCVSLIAIGEADADLRHCIYMACDPMLNKDTAFDLDVELSVAFLNAASTGEALGYYQYNELLYETTYNPEGELAEVSMSLYNIYASEFRELSKISTK